MASLAMLATNPLSSTGLPVRLSPLPPIKRGDAIDFNGEENLTGLSSLIRSYYRGQHDLKIRWLTGKFTLYPRVDKIIPHHLAGGENAMGLSVARISRKEDKTQTQQGIQPAVNRSDRGMNGLTRLGKELLEDGLAYLWRFKCGKIDWARYQQMVFWTVTTPSRYADGEKFTDEDYRKIQRGWPDLVKRIGEEIRREQERLGIEPHYLYCVEPQDERFERYGQFCLHLHYVLLNVWDAKADAGPLGFDGSRREGAYVLQFQKTDAIVTRVFSNFMGREVDCSNACSIETIKGLKKLAEYMTKIGEISAYFKKGTEQFDKYRKLHIEGKLSLPKSWYGADYELKCEVRGACVRVENFLPDSDIKWFSEWLDVVNSEFAEEHGRNLFKNKFRVYIEGVDSPVAMTFQVKRLTDVYPALEFLGQSDLLPVSVEEEWYRVKARDRPTEVMLD